MASKTTQDWDKYIDKVVDGRNFSYYDIRFLSEIERNGALLKEAVRLMKALIEGHNKAYDWFGAGECCDEMILNLFCSLKREMKYVIEEYDG